MTEESFFDTEVLLEDNALKDQLLALIEKGESGAANITEKLHQEISSKVLSFINEHVSIDHDTCVGLLKTSTPFNVNNFPGCSKPDPSYEVMINLKSINDTLMLNQLFQGFNNKLRTSGVFVGCVETYQLRKKRLLKKYPLGLNYAYYFFDYIFKRVFPKIILLDKLYFFVTAGRNRAISETEALGRLNYCGFEVQDTIVDRNLMYFAAKQIEHVEKVEEKNYRIFLRLPRKGKGGKVINVYKLRTMFPYSEYIQGYVYKKNQLSEGGKFQNDFRISLLGRILRKYFLDEIPMILNLLKGDLKLVGVRPLSKQYFSLYDEDLQSQRLRHKPGLIPPYYADLPKTIEDIQESERKYLNAYEKSPLKTDVKYLYLATRNILFKSARSK